MVLSSHENPIICRQYCMYVFLVILCVYVLLMLSFVCIIIYCYNPVKVISEQNIENEGQQYNKVHRSFYNKFKRKRPEIHQ